MSPKTTARFLLGRASIVAKCRQSRCGRLIVFAGVCLGGVLLGGILTRDGLLMWDDFAQWQHSRSLLSSYGLLEGKTAANNFYAPLWELVLGILSEIVFVFLRDPTWVRHAFTFALYPAFLFVVFRSLRSCGICRATATLCVAGLFSFIRLGGHALFNTKDFPGAVAFTVSTLGMWILWQKFSGAQSSSERNRIPIALGIVAVLPYLVRSPLLLHFVLLLGFLALYAVLGSDALPLRKRFALVAVPTLSGVLCIFLLSPYLWNSDLYNWVKPLTHFSHYTPWTGSIRMFGFTLSSHNLPWWYGIAWLPVIIHPVGFLLFVFGCVSILARKKIDSIPCILRTSWGTLKISLPIWIGCIVLFTWSVVIIKRPALYDEERHLLFLFPLTYLLGFLGLDILSSRLKYFLSIALVLCGLYAYGMWGRFSYVYKSPIIGDISSNRFMGDYWGLCIGEATKALQGRVPGGYSVLIKGPVSVAQLQRNRLRQSLLFGKTAIDKYRFTSTVPKKPYAVIAINREHLADRVRIDLESEKATLLWESKMPPNDTACILALYPKSE